MSCGWPKSTYELEVTKSDVMFHGETISQCDALAPSSLSRETCAIPCSIINATYCDMSSIR